MTTLLWASFTVCAVIGILAMGILAIYLAGVLMGAWLRRKRLSKLFIDFMWQQRVEERRRK